MANKIDPKVWRKHRPTIEREYSRKDRRLVDVVAYMKEHHDFAARSETQYGRQLKKWGLRKNLTKDEWIAIITFLEKNSLSCDKVEVLWCGTILPPDQVIREIKRYRSRMMQQPGSNISGTQLPSDIDIRPQSSALIVRNADILQMEHAPATDPQVFPTQDNASHDISYTGIEMIMSPSIMNHNARSSHTHFTFEAPFSWIDIIRMEWLWPSTSQSLSLITTSQPSPVQLNSAFYPNQETFKGPFLYQIASLLNNMLASSPSTPNEVYAWLKMIPGLVLVQTLKALPIAMFDALRERIFVLGMRAGDMDIVSAMLALNIDPREPIMIEPAEATPMYPLEYAVTEGHFLIAKRLLSHVLRGASESRADQLLRHVLTSTPRLVFWEQESERLEMVELMCLALSAGANPVYRCLLHCGSLSCIQTLIQASTVDFSTWFRLGLVGYCFGIAVNDHYGETREKEILQYVLHHRRENLPEDDAKFKTTLIDGLHRAVQKRCQWVIEIILPEMIHLGYRGESIFVPKSHTCSSYLKACDHEDWALAASIMIADTERARRRPPSPPPSLPVQPTLFKQKLEKIVSETRNTSLEEISLEDYDGYLNERVAILRAIELNHPQIASALVRSSDVSAREELWCLLLEQAAISTVSALLLSEPRWCDGLKAAREQNDYGPLAALIYGPGSSPPLFPWGFPYIEQLCFRAIAYHAIATDDYRLCKWLRQLGMIADELCYYEDGYLADVYVRTHVTDDITGMVYGNLRRATFPSILTIVAARGLWPWVEFLDMEGVDMRDSLALLRAVKSDAESKTLYTLLDAAKRQRCSRSRTYGSAALGFAIRSRRSDVVRILCTAVDLDSAEWVTEECLGDSLSSEDLSSEEDAEESGPVTPLGEAILLDDNITVQLLLEVDANPNACVSPRGMSIPKHINSMLPRVSPLLAAIDMQTLPIAKLLVKHGAEIDYAQNFGMLRTPLQRAAEVGNFDIVQYLIGQGARIDTNPMPSGGTALQLAAMNGHVGIAQLLLDEGANPNYPPARGEGRTAFEAAAEWAHYDMVLLLMRSGVDLDLKVGDPPESQYHRAQTFARDKGNMASKRHVERLYTQQQVQRRQEDAHMLPLSPFATDWLSSVGSMPSPVW